MISRFLSSNVYKVEISPASIIVGSQRSGASTEVAYALATKRENKKEIIQAIGADALALEGLEGVSLYAGSQKGPTDKLGIQFTSDIVNHCIYELSKRMPFELLAPIMIVRLVGFHASFSVETARHAAHHIGKNCGARKTFLAPNSEPIDSKLHMVPENLV